MNIEDLLDYLECNSAGTRYVTCYTIRLPTLYVSWHFMMSSTKPSLKIRTASAIFWNYLGIFRDYGLKNIFFRNKTFLFFKIESWNFQHLFEKEFRETSQNFNSIRQTIEKMKIKIVSMKFFFKQMLKVSAFYLKKTKKFYS